MLTPEAYNIELTRHGQVVEFNFEPATADNIWRFGYLQPQDNRCITALVHQEQEILDILKPVIGSQKVSLNYSTKYSGIVQLHHVAIVGFQRQAITDPRIGANIANLWEVYIDKRIFPMWEDNDWCFLFGELISQEQTQELAKSIKDRLIEQAARD